MADAAKIIYLKDRLRLSSRATAHQRSSNSLSKRRIDIEPGVNQSLSVHAKQTCCFAYHWEAPVPPDGSAPLHRRGR